ncbi:MAG TPA: LL-diaminopimelate aminotransferase [Candidatus Limnocylindrales bacterium]|nr:LL-diaminopimelate aminotransferase [Candidatus Limnocylindrales bacterium]
MARINENYRKLVAGYLFPEINRRVRLFQQEHPEAKILRLGIGNTTEPLTPTVIAGLREGVEKLAAAGTYTGYGDEQGDEPLRKRLADFYARRGVILDVDQFFISDGAKPDSGNIQSIFSNGSRVAFQDPAYPVYVDSNVVAGRSGFYDSTRGTYTGFVYMPSTRTNGFIPDLPRDHVDILYLCSPNNPTGAVMARDVLKRFVDYALEHRAVIIFDASYAEFITDPKLPRSIYEVEGAVECAIEINSFSKFAGFTGVRLGWTVVPKELIVEDSEPGEVHELWLRRQTTFFNGASNIAQRGGLAVLSENGIKESGETIGYYMENARIIKEGLFSMGLTVFGGDNAPYLWLETPGNLSSWDFFDKLLREAWVIGTPGSGFGPSGEGYLRLSAFGHREDIKTAVDSIKTKLKL